MKVAANQVDPGDLGPILESEHRFVISAPPIGR